MSPAPPLTGNTRVITAAIMLVALVGVGLSLLNPLLAVALEREGISARLSGLSAGAAGLGTILMVLFMGPLTQRLGVAGVLGLAIATSALLSLLFPLIPGLPAWTLLRFGLGAALGAIFALSEFWINVAAPPARRGLIIGIYATTLYAGFALGPVLLGTVIGDGALTMLPFVIAASIMGLGIVPLALVRGAAPRLEAGVSASPLRFVRAAPVATLGTLVFGVVETGAILLLPVHALRLGLSVSHTAYLVAAFTLGNVALQIPLGLLSDKVGRLPLIVALALSSGLCLLGLLLTPSPLVMGVLLFLAGGISGGIYPMALALLGERFSGSDLAAANGAVVMLYSLGLMVGPPVLGQMIDTLGTSGFPLSMGGLLAVYGMGAWLAHKKTRVAP